jgi:hypothetical protein
MMFNWDFLLGLCAGAATCGLAVWFYNDSKAASGSGQITDSVTAAPVESQITEAVTTASSTTLTIAPTVVSAPRRGRKPSAKTAAKKPAKKTTAKRTTARRTR